MKKRLAMSLRFLVHRAGDVHQAEHHGLRRRLRHADAVVVAQVEGVDEGDASMRWRAGCAISP
jgi:hypothetical protein